LPIAILILPIAIVSAAPKSAQLRHEF